MVPEIGVVLLWERDLQKEDGDGDRFIWDLEITIVRFICNCGKEGQRGVLHPLCQEPLAETRRMGLEADLCALYSSDVAF